MQHTVRSIRLISIVRFCIPLEGISLRCRWLYWTRWCCKSVRQTASRQQVLMCCSNLISQAFILYHLTSLKKTCQSRYCSLIEFPESDIQLQILSFYSDTEMINTGICAFDAEYLGRPLHHWYLFHQIGNRMVASVTLSGWQAIRTALAFLRCKESNPATPKYLFQLKKDSK